MKIGDGAFQFRIPMRMNPDAGQGHLRYTLIYAVETPQGFVLIDVGMDSDQGIQALQAQLEEAGIGPRSVSLILGTHAHGDHVGLVSRVKALTGARLAMHRLDAPNLNVSPFRFRIPPATVEVLLDGSEELVPGSGLRVIWTPGHTPGHVCIHDTRRKLLFTGDHMLPTITPNVSLMPGNEDANPLDDFRRGQLALKHLDVAMVHPAHEHSFPHLARRVDEILEHHEQRNQEVLAAVDAGARTAWDIARRIRWNIGPWEKFNVHARRSALWETQAHIKALMVQGLLVRTEEGSVALLEELRPIVGKGADHRVALVGVGLLGRAALRSSGDGPDGFRVVAAFDADPRVVGRSIHGVTVLSMQELGQTLPRDGIRSAVVAVPPPFVQEVVDHLAESGVTAILNCAPVELRTPSRVRVRSVEGNMALQAGICYSRPGAARS